MFGSLLGVPGAVSLTAPMLAAVLAYLLALGVTVIATQEDRT